MEMLIPAEDIAHAIVAGFLGLELLANLDGDQQPALALFERAALFAGLLDHNDRPGVGVPPPMMGDPT